MAVFVPDTYKRNKIGVVHKPEHLWHICVKLTNEHGTLANKHSDIDRRGVDDLGN